jgi:asparagine synthase (glutamine-hydrolysing)
MCGIAGFFNRRENSTVKETISKMCRTLEHRGPDDLGIDVQDNYAIGMRRLSIIDQDGGQQPFFSDDRRYRIVYNGELYNYLEIKSRLLDRGVQFRTKSDTEVVLKSYLHYGSDCLQAFNGMYAFAIFDVIKKEFFIARDRLGVKPLYYTTLQGRGFAFASEIKALVHVPRFDRRIDQVALSQFLTFEYIPEPRTIYEHVKKLPASTYLTFSANHGTKINTYWQLEAKTPEASNMKQACNGVRDLIHSSVNYRLVSDVSVGLFLSGGIDSSVVATEMKASAGTKSPASFSIGFDEKSYDESPFAETVARHLDLSHQARNINERSMLNLLPEIIHYLDEPLADASIVPTYLLSQHASKSVKVVLSGDGGDELFLGYDIHKAHKFGQIFRFLPQRMIGYILDSLNVLPVSDKNASLEFKLKKFFSSISYRPDIANILWWGAYSPDLLQKVLPDNKSSFEEIFDPVLSRRDQVKGFDLLKQISYLDIHLYLRDNLLAKVDRMSMANSLEVRSPFLDYRLAEYAMQLPSNWKLKGRCGKYIVKRAYKSELPTSILKRSKKGFDIPLASWLRGDLLGLCNEYFSKQKIEQTGVFDYSFVKSLTNQHLCKKRNHRQLIWPLLIYQMWHENYG